ncbi:hypothetical protein C7212DRAFT_363789 [Tuber magnatum]|uniref:Uncharacterized protein n=1 Tax=Tuber magnatum TaxID=42249 RepID=A0A317SQY9_9PEZI|nr:hypothetical protein C7212DRAFT_363789 [Tuber magnatum]
MPTLPLRPPAPKLEPEAPSTSELGLPAPPATPRRVCVLRPVAPQAHCHTIGPIGGNPCRFHNPGIRGSIPTISAPTRSVTPPGPPSSPSSPITATSTTSLPSSPLTGPGLSSRMTSSFSSPARIPKPKVTHAHKQARKLIRSVRRMHAQICVAKLSVLDESARRDVAGLKREVIVFLNTAQEVYFYLTAGDDGWRFDADFSRMAVVTGKWFRRWRGVRKELESRRERKGGWYGSGEEDDCGDDSGDFNGFS